MIPSTVERTIWDELPAANVDTTKLEHLFESRAKDLLTKVCKRNFRPNETTFKDCRLPFGVLHFMSCLTFYEKIHSKA